MAFAEIFGDVLLTKDGEKPTEAVLAGKTAIGLYFSAHWCPPCRAFTPQLAGMYKDVLTEKGMEIIFVSSDKDQGSFDEYYGEMPWCALPFSKRAEKDQLSKKFKVSGIPMFVILGPDGALITNDGRGAVSKDPKAERYPWHPPSKADKAKMVLDALGSELVGKTGGKPIGLYFSAHWCPPCRGFTPKLAEYYKDGLKDKMEIIFVSSDRDQGSFDEYYKEMPWLALPFENRQGKNVLSEVCGVEGIPSFVVVGQDGAIITTDGRSKVQKDPKAATFPDGWLPQPFNDVNDDPSDLNDEKCLIALGSSESTAAAVKAVAAEHYVAANKDISAMEMRFYSGPDGDVTEQIRNLTKLPSGDKLVLLDIPSGGAFYVCGGDANDAAAVKAFLDDIKAGKCEKRQLEK